MDYIANSKNRKLKKQIISFLDRINFGAGRLPISGRVVLLFTCILAITIFLPWFRFEYGNKDIEIYTAFSQYTGYVGYGILVSVFLIPFFLLSHTKKEKIRSMVPFRLSDTQLIVFVATMILVSLLHLLFMMPIFSQFAFMEIKSGYLLALTSTSCIIISAFFLSKKSKEESIELRHLDHRSDAQIPDEYATILGKKQKNEGLDDSNMVLPI